ncbi:MAG: DUF692 domain-containing protein [Elusimicrobia bacterium]|nr:DUF692 domain-containing protein [Elusimicrobiota bacterium]
MAVERGSAGLAYHACLEDDFLIERRSLGHVSVLADHFLDRPESWPSLARLKSFLPVVAHGVDLSLGSAEGLDAGYVRKLVEFLDALRPAWFGEHIAFTRAGGRRLGHLGPLPFNEESVRALSRNLAAVRPELPCPVILENISTPFPMPGTTWCEPEFIRRVLDACDCGFLLDLHNLHADAHNQGFDASMTLDALPVERVVEVHIAGGFRDGRWLVDSHTRPVPEEVYGLLARLRGHGVDPAVTLEWDRDFPPFDAWLAVLDRVRATRKLTLGTVPSVNFPVRAAVGMDLGALQREFVEAALAPAGSVEGIEPEALAHFAAGLRKKKRAYSVGSGGGAGAGLSMWPLEAVRKAWYFR